MGTIIPPALFGIDPDEVWEYVPEKARNLPEGQAPTFTLSAPDAALDQEMELAESALRRAVKDAFPADEYAEIVQIETTDKEKRTEEQNARYPVLLAKWVAKWSEEANKVDQLPLMRKVFAKCVKGWKNFRTPKKELVFPSDASKIVDMLSRELRTEMFLAIKKGMEVTQEERESLT